MKLFLGSGGYSTPERKEFFIKSGNDFLKNVNSILFVPYAIQDHDYYFKRMKEINFHFGKNFDSIHFHSDKFAAVKNAECIYIGGGNSFRLLKKLQDLDLMNVIREKIISGTPYVGTSAGSNVAGPTIKTTNDMPIVQPKSFGALNLFPYQINPHYFEGAFYYKQNNDFIPYGGETRDDRLEEFHEENETPIIALWEGTHLIVDGKDLSFHGEVGPYLMKPKTERVVLKTGYKYNIDSL